MNRRYTMSQHSTIVA